MPVQDAQADGHTDLRTEKARRTDADPFPDGLPRKADAEQQPSGVAPVERIVCGVVVWRSCESLQRVNAEELSGAGVIYPVAEIDESGVSAGVLGVVAEWCGGGAFAGGGSVGSVAAFSFHGARFAGEEPG
jgi:hypothetical protein